VKAWTIPSEWTYLNLRAMFYRPDEFGNKKKNGIVANAATFPITGHIFNGFPKGGE
jgi:hypothetical protein